MKKLLVILSTIFLLSACESEETKKEQESKNTISIPERTEKQKLFYAENTCHLDATINKEDHKAAYKCGQSAGMEICKKYFDEKLCTAKPE